MGKSRKFSEELRELYKKGKRLVFMEITISEIMELQQKLLERGDIEMSERWATVSSELIGYQNEDLAGSSPGAKRMSKQITPKHFVEGEDVTWELSPYHQGMGIIRGRVQGMPNLDVEETWWVVELRDPNKIGNYEYSCIVLPSYRLEAIPR